MNQTLGMEPSEWRALQIIKLASEQAGEIAALQRELDAMTERCRAAEYRLGQRPQGGEPTLTGAELEELKRAAAEAADIYEVEITRLRSIIHGIAEFCSGDDQTLSAIQRLAHIRNTAERATALTKADSVCVSNRRELYNSSTGEK